MQTKKPNIWILASFALAILAAFALLWNTADENRQPPSIPRTSTEIPDSSSEAGKQPTFEQDTGYQTRTAFLQAQIDSLLTPDATVQDARETAALYHEWGLLDPQAAIAHIQENIPHVHAELIAQLMTVVFKAWAQNDLQEAWNHITLVPKISGHSHVSACQAALLEQCMQPGTRASFQRAIALIESKTQSADPNSNSFAAKTRLLDSALKTIARHDLDYAFSLVDEAASLGHLQTDPLEKARVEQFTSTIAIAWAEKNPRAAADWALVRLENPDKRLIARLSQIWFEQDPVSPFSWLDSNFSGEELDTYTKLAVLRISEKRPHEIADLIGPLFLESKSLPVSGSYIALARNLSPTHPELALQVIEKHEEFYEGKFTGSLNYQKAHTIIDWAIIDEEAADAFLASLDPENPFDAKTLEFYQRELKLDTPKNLFSSVYMDWGRTDYSSYEVGIGAALPLQQELLETNTNHYLEIAIREYAKISPERIRYILKKQTALSPERTAQLLEQVAP